MQRLQGDLKTVDCYHGKSRRIKRYKKKEKEQPKEDDQQEEKNENDV